MSYPKHSSSLLKANGYNAIRTSHNPVSRAFVDACLGRPYFNGADADVGLKVVRAIDAMYRSAKSGKAEACA